MQFSVNYCHTWSLGWIEYTSPQAWFKLTMLINLNQVEIRGKRDKIWLLCRYGLAMKIKMVQVANNFMRA